MGKGDSINQPIFMPSWLVSIKNKVVIDIVWTLPATHPGNVQGIKQSVINSNVNM
jgi:hypothetical protein